MKKRLLSRKLESEKLENTLLDLVLINMDYERQPISKEEQAKMRKKIQRKYAKEG